MNLEHLKAILWLRWRLAANRWRRQGALNAVLFSVFAVMAVVMSVLVFVVSLCLGVFALEDAEPDHLLLLWDAVVVAFLFFWMIGLVVELQRSEALSLDKLLHLPISLTGTFVLNYLTSLASLPMMFFVPVMIGLGLGLVIARGPSMLIMLPLIVSFMFMITGVTHQFRGWLATLMVNKRRRRTIIAVVTMTFIVIVQVPNLIQFSVRDWGEEASPGPDSPTAEEVQSWIDSGRSYDLLDGPDPGDSPAEVLAEGDPEAAGRARAERRERRLAAIVDQALIVNVILPIGWLPYGARAAAQGQVLPGLIGTLGPLIIGTASLWWSYRMTLRFYTGGYQARKRRRAPTVEPEASTGRQTAGDVRLLEKQLPWVSEHAAGVALANFRSLTRAPEAKMVLLTPIILMIVFGSMLLARDLQAMGDSLRALLGLGGIAVAMFSLIQLMQNQFGFDRGGFRVYVLAPIPRSDVLLGKNLAIAPFAMGMSLFGIAALQLLLPMRATHLAATLLQMPATYIIYSSIGNLISMWSPLAIKSGAFNPAKPTATAVLIQMVFVILFPVALLPALVPLGIEYLLGEFIWGDGVPIYLLLSCIELTLILWAYKHVLQVQGRMLQEREQRILDTVTAEVE